MKKILLICLLFTLAFYSCKNKPSKDEISRCLLKNFDCGDYAKINSLKIVNSQQQQFMGIKGYTVIVDGEIEWTKDCESFLGVIRAGDKQQFKNKTVYLTKMDNGWGCQ